MLEKGMHKGVSGDACPPRDTPSLQVAHPCDASAQRLVIGDVLRGIVTHTSGILFRLTPQRAVVAEFSTCGSPLDTELKLFRGCPLSGGHLLALSDDECGHGSSFTAALETGVEYFVTVNGFEGQVRAGAVRCSRARSR